MFLIQRCPFVQGCPLGGVPLYMCQFIEVMTLANIQQCPSVPEVAMALKCVYG